MATEEMTAYEERAKKEQRICDLKTHLTATDYKVIKNLTAKALGEEEPYDLKDVEAKRQAMRDEINALQAELAAE